MPNPFYNCDVVSIKDFGINQLTFLFKATDRLMSLSKEKRLNLCKGRALAYLFFEPSTRTKLSFESAMFSLGGYAFGFSDIKGTSIEKGENLTDTLRVVDGYADVIVIRHSREGAAKYAAEICEKPVINAGSGAEEHPTQAMLDLYTIIKEKGRIDGLNIAVVGDLKYARTVYSLLHALSNFSPNIYLVSPSLLRLRQDVYDELSKKVKLEEHESLDKIINDIDVMYVIRIQKERFPDPHDYERVKGSYFIDSKLLSKAKSDLIILHPLPRVDEISYEVDELKQARYFKQAQLGYHLRAALLTLILNEEPKEIIGKEIE
jgi:aspartate carbamoyltransferase catalytic subunit